MRDFAIFGVLQTLYEESHIPPAGTFIGGYALGEIERVISQYPENQNLLTQIEENHPDGMEILKLLATLLEKTHEQPSITFTYAMLDEIERLVRLFLDKEDEQGRITAWLFIADAYYSLGHYLFALKYYGKALERLEQCGGSIADDEDLCDTLYDSFTNMLDIYKKMDKKKAAKKLLSIIKKVMPSSLDAIKKVRRSHLKCDPVEYTEAYMAILPELEAKIDAELGGVTKGLGFCFSYWYKKGEILKRDYGIEWDSPGVLNPHVRFD
jgi:tetratricopeptide (TPR) repeat protein